MNLITQRLSILFLAVLVLVSCNENDNIGGSILTNDDLNLETASLPVSLKQLNPKDSILYYSATAGRAPNLLLIGQIEDANFGKTTAEGYLQLIPGNQLTDFSLKTVDSVVLKLAYDSLNFYGDIEVMQTMEVREITEVLPNNLNYYTNDVFEVDPTAIAVNTFRPRPGASVVLDTNTTLGPHLRFRLPIEFGDRIINLDSSILTNTDAFLNEFPGFHIRTNTIAGQLMAFLPYNGDQARTELVIYYKDQEGEAENLNFIPLATFRTVVSQFIEYDYTGSLAEQILNGTVTDRFIIQGTNGLRPQLTIDGLANLGDILVNRAELDLYLDEETSGYEVFGEPQNLIFELRGITGNLESITEHAAGSNTIPNFSVVSSELSADPSQNGYRFNLPFYTQQAINGQIFEPELFINTVPNLLNPRRCIIFGDRPSKPLRLKLTYTEN